MMKRRDFLRSASAVPAATSLVLAPVVNAAAGDSVASGAGESVRASGAAALGYREPGQGQWHAWRESPLGPPPQALRLRVLGFAAAAGALARLDVIAWHPTRDAGTLPFYAWSHRSASTAVGCCSTSAPVAFALGDASLEFRFAMPGHAPRSLRLGGAGRTLLAGTYALLASASPQLPAWSSIALDADGRALAPGSTVDALLFALEPFDV